MSQARPDRATALVVIFEYTQEVDYVFGLTNANEQLTITRTVLLNGVPTSQQVVCAPDPRLSFELQDRSFTLDEDDITVETSNTLALISQLGRGRAAPEIRMSGLEISTIGFDQPSVDAQAIYHFENVPMSVEQNPPGKPGTAVWTIRNPKELTNVTSNEIAVDQCINEFGASIDLGISSVGSGTCQRFLFFDIVDANITAINNNLITVDALPPRDGSWWKDGEIRARGVSMKIRGWAGGLEFQTSLLPPVDWIDTLVGGPIPCEVLPGCDHTSADCALFEQTRNFRSYGTAIPLHNTNFERPRS